MKKYKISIFLILIITFATFEPGSLLAVSKNSNAKFKIENKVGEGIDHSEVERKEPILVPENGEEILNENILKEDIQSVSPRSFSISSVEENLVANPSVEDANATNSSL